MLPAFFHLCSDHLCQQLVALAHPHRREPERLVHRLRAPIADAHLEGEVLGVARPRELLGAVVRLRLETGRGGNFGSGSVGIGFAMTVLFIARI